MKRRGDPRFAPGRVLTSDDAASTVDPQHLSRPRGHAEFSLPSSFVRLRRGERLYQEGERVEALFHIVTGVVKLYTTFLDGKQHIMSFSFSDDLIGLAPNCTHVSSAEALTPVTAYRMPMAAISARLRSKPDLESHLIFQLSHELHQARRHATLLSRHRATARIGLFLQMLEANQNARGVSSQEIFLPMKRSDIGAYVGMSLEAVGRSFRRLASRGAITIRDRRYVQITNRAEFEAALLDQDGRN
jgi:CRP/FNR family transcriptional regulator